MSIRRIKFNGFAAGSAGAIAASLASGASDSSSFSAWGQTGSAPGAGTPKYIFYPRRSASHYVPGGTFKIFKGIYSGSPTPSVEGTVTVGGTPVSLTDNGDRYTGIIPVGVSNGTAVVYAEVATNSEGAYASGAYAQVLVHASFVPVYATALPSISPANPEPGDTVTVTWGTFAGTSSISVDNRLRLAGVDVTDDMVGSSYTIPAGTLDQIMLSASSSAKNKMPGGSNYYSKHWDRVIVNGVEWDQPSATPSAEIAIERRNPGKFAPDGIIFKVTNLQGWDTPEVHVETGGGYKPRYHDIEVFWDFGDEGAVYSAPVKTLAAHKNRNVSKGHRAAHVYRSPGSYTITAFLVEMSSGKTATATLTLSGDTGAITDAVKDPEIVFAGDMTNWIGPVETHAAAEVAYPGCKKFTSYLPNADSTISKSRVMFASGHEEAFDRVGNWRYFCAEPGAAVRPKLTPTADADEIFRVGTGAPADGFQIIQGIDLEGGWDATTETWTFNTSNPVGVNVDAKDSQIYVLCDDVTTNGLHNGFGSFQEDDSPNEGPTLILHDIFCTNWQNFGSYIGGYMQYAVFLGARITQPVDAMGGGWKGGSYNNHGPIRVEGAKHLIVDGCDLFSNTGWTSNIGGFQSYQPCIRVNGSCIVGAETDVSRCSMEGGGQVMTAFDSAGGAMVPDFVHNWVADSNVVIGSHSNWSDIISTSYGGLTARNNLMIVPDTLRLVPTFSPKFVGTAGRKWSIHESQIDLLAPVQIYNNTAINLQTPENAGDGVGTLPFFENGAVEPNAAGPARENILVENNIMHEPNATGGVTTYAPLDDTPLFTPRTNGYRDNWPEAGGGTDGANWPEYATPADAVWAGIPLTGSAAIGAATSGLVSYADILLQPRPAAPSIGAWEAA